MHRFRSLLILALTGFSSAQEAEKPYALGGAFGPAWSVQNAEWVAADERSGPVALLRGGDNPETWSSVGFAFEAPPTERQLELDVLVRGTATNHAVSINAFAYDESGESLQTWSKASRLTAEWQPLHRTFVLPPDTVKWTIYFINQASHDVRIAEAQITVGAAAAVPLKNLSGPGIIRATANTLVRAGLKTDEGQVWFPIPLLTDCQVPLTFQLQVDPPEALKGYRWIPREDGVNWLCEVDLERLGEATRVRWTSLVLVGDRADAELPHVERGVAAEELQGWLRSTACIQSADEEIRGKAEELWSAALGLGDFVEDVIGFTSTNRGTGAPFLSLDAKAAMSCGGSCTSRANLAAALLRAGGVPARTSAHLPTWSGPLYEHWHVEYWHPGVGWTWVEPTLGKMRPKPYSLVVLNVARPDDEDQSFSPAIRRSGVMLGAPRHAVHEHSEGLRRPRFKTLSKMREHNSAVAVVHLSGDGREQEALFAAARSAWRNLSNDAQAGAWSSSGGDSIEEALAAGDVTSALTRALSVPNSNTK